MSAARSTVSTGPKISSRASGTSGSSTATTVGGTKYPAARHVGVLDEHTALPGSVLERAEDPLVGVLVDDRAHLRLGPPGRAHDQLAGGADQPVDDLVVDVAHDDEPAGGRALLARVAEGREHRAGHRLVGVGVGVDDQRVLAAHLGDDPLDVALARGGRRPPAG